jgi:hypothetical protein
LNSGNDVQATPVKLHDTFASSAKGGDYNDADAGDKNIVQLDLKNRSFTTQIPKPAMGPSVILESEDVEMDDETYEQNLQKVYA